NLRRVLLVKALADRSIPRAQARKLYEDVTPPLSAEMLEARRLDRLLAPSRSEGRPDRRERRERRHRKAWQPLLTINFLHGLRGSLPVLRGPVEDGFRPEGGD